MVAGMVTGMVPRGKARIRLLGDSSVGVCFEGVDYFPPDELVVPLAFAQDMVEHRKRAEYVKPKAGRTPRVEARDPTAEYRDPEPAQSEQGSR